VSRGLVLEVAASVESRCTILNDCGVEISARSRYSILRSNNVESSMDPHELATTTEASDSELLVSYFVPTLRVLYSGAEGVVNRAPVVLQTGPTVVGRTPSGPSRIGLPHDRRVSRDHFRLHVSVTDGIRAKATDLNSRNGMRIDGARTKEAELHDGTLIRVGNSFMIFRHEPTGMREVTSSKLVGVSPSIRELRRNVALFAPSEATVLITGESGTGKEVTARALHQAMRKERSFHCCQLRGNPRVSRREPVLWP